MRQAEFSRALGLVIRKLAEIIIKPLWPTAIVTGPECRLADRAASRGDHRLVVIRHAADHVSVWLDVAHGQSASAPSHAPTAPLPGAFAIGSAVGSLSDI